MVRQEEAAAAAVALTVIASRRIVYGADRTTIGPAASANDTAAYARADVPTENECYQYSMR